MITRALGASRRGTPIVVAEAGAPTGGLLVFGAIHGDEPASAVLCDRFIAEARDLEGPPLAIVRVVNPDGLAAGSQYNANGVDLNRNFAARNWTRDHRPGYEPGPFAASEPETVALARLVEDRRPRAIVAVHQPFACVNWDGPADDLATLMSARSSLPLRPSIGYPTPGSFGSFAGVDRGFPVITLELARVVDEDAYVAAVAALHVAWRWCT